MDSKVLTFNLHCVVFDPSETLLSMPRIFPTQISTLSKDLSFRTFFNSVHPVSSFTSTFQRSRFFLFSNFSYLFLDDVKAHVNRCYINIIITTFFQVFLHLIFPILTMFSTLMDNFVSITWRAQSNNNVSKP